jgi:hypothetical protein
LGMGIAMPLFVIAVQNAVPYRIMGVATSSVQFFQSIGQAVGLAIFGSIMVSRFSSNVMGDEAITRLGIPHEVLSGITSNPLALMNAETLARLQATLGSDLSGRLLELFGVDMAPAITGVFVIGTVVIAVALVVTLFLKEVPLRKSHEPTFSE